MPGEQVDALLLVTRFDESGLDASARAQLDALRDFANRVGQLSQNIPPLDLDTEPFAAALRASGGDVADFFSGLRQGILEGVAEFQQLAGAVPPIAPAVILPPALPPDPNLRLLARGYEGVAFAAEQARLKAEALRQTMLQSGQAAVRAADGANAWARGMATLRAQQQGLDASLAGTIRGADRVRSGLTALAVQASGASPAVASVVSGLLLMGAGSTVVAGAAAGIALVAAGYRALTEDARRAREEQEKLNEAFDKAIAARNPLP